MNFYEDKYTNYYEVAVSILYPTVLDFIIPNKF